MPTAQHDRPSKIGNLDHAQNLRELVPFNDEDRWVLEAAANEIERLQVAAGSPGKPDGAANVAADDPKPSPEPVTGIEAIRARHAEDDACIEAEKAGAGSSRWELWSAVEIAMHADRATLLAEVERLTRELADLDDENEARFGLNEKYRTQLDQFRGDIKTTEDVLQEFDGNHVWQQAQAAVKALDEARALLRKCATEGYSRAEINAFLGSQAEKVSDRGN